MSVSINNTQVITDSRQAVNVSAVTFSDGSSQSSASSGNVFSTVNSAGLIRTLANPSIEGVASGNQFGAEAMAVYGNYAIVGAFFESDFGYTTGGRAYIFDIKTGKLIHILNNPNAYISGAFDGSDNFGRSVGISDKYAIVGAPFEDQSGNENSGRVYIFDIQTGLLVNTLNNPNAYSTSAGDRFGYYIAISGNYAVVGVPEESATEGQLSGKAYVFDVVSGTLVHILNNPNAYSTGTGDGFGTSVDISDKYIIVGVPNEEDSGGAVSGKAYVFSIGSGQLVYTLNNPNAFSTSAGDYFGISVGIAGNYAVVSAREEDEDGLQASGKVYVFNLTAGSLVHTFNNPNIYGLPQFDYFGWSVDVSISGNETYAVISSTGENSYLGIAYVYKLSNGSLFRTLHNPSSAAYGSVVAISGNYALVSSTGANSSRGVVYVFSLEDTVQISAVEKITFASGRSVSSSHKAFTVANNAGELIHYLHHLNLYGDIDTNDLFGASVAVSGNYCIVSSPGEAPATFYRYGVVYVYNLTTGKLLRAITNPSSDPLGDDFGYEIDLSGNLCIVGAPADGDSGANSGRAYIFDVRTGSLIRTLTNPNTSPTINDRFGSSVAISGNYCAVSAMNEDNIGSDSGTVYVYNVITGATVNTFNNSNAYSTASNDLFGLYIALSKNYLVVGAPFEDSSLSENIGRVYVYHIITGQLLYSVANPNIINSGINDDRFGQRVAVYGNYFAASATFEDSDTKIESGIVYIFDIDTGALTYILQNPITSDYCYFGEDISLSQNYCCIGSTEGGNLASGYAYIYDISGNNLSNDLWLLTSEGGVTPASASFSVNNTNVTLITTIQIHATSSTGKNWAGAFSKFTSHFIVRIHDFGTIANYWTYRVTNVSYAGSILNLTVSFIYRTPDSQSSFTTGLDNQKITFYKIDPIVTLTNPNAYGSVSGDYFGYACGITDNYCVVSAKYEDDLAGNNVSNTGKTYIFSVKDQTYIDKISYMVK